MEVFNEFLQNKFEDIREHALQLSRMGPYYDGDAVEYITFLKESFKHRLHSLLWNSQDKMAVYAASTRYSHLQCNTECTSVCLTLLGSTEYKLCILFCLF